MRNKLTGKSAFWWGDDRMVPPTDSESNYGEVQKRLFDHIQFQRETSTEFVENEPHFELKRFEEELMRSFQTVFLIDHFRYGN